MKPEAKTQNAVRASWRGLFAFLAIVVIGCGQSTTGHSQTIHQVIKAFDGISGMSPVALIEGSDGHLYGATEAGGSKGEGLVFRMGKDGGSYTVLHHFLGSSQGGDGSAPQGLVEGKDGVLFGTTKAGGQRGGVVEASLGGTGNGTVFKLNKDGTDYIVLRRFTCSNGDGCEPWAGVVEGRDGWLYGTTFEDSRDHQGVFGSGHGTVFKLGKDGGGYRVLYTFMTVPPDGHRPLAALLANSDGVLYGTTDSGGTGQSQNGTLFKLNPDGSGYRVLHNFHEIRGDGRTPRDCLVEGRDGALYGTTQNGGANDYGTVFRLNRDGSGYRVLHNFTGGDQTGDGAEPEGLIQGKDGVLYGTARHHGKENAGTVFRLNNDGSDFALLHSFAPNHGAGSKPNGLIQAKDGSIYGTTIEGGVDNGGTLFRLSLSPSRPALSPASK